MTPAKPGPIDLLLIMILIVSALGSILGAGFAKWQLMSWSFVSLCFALNLLWRRRQRNQQEDDV